MEMLVKSVDAAVCFVAIICPYGVYLDHRVESLRFLFPVSKSKASAFTTVNAKHSLESPTAERSFQHLVKLDLDVAIARMTMSLTFSFDVCNGRFARLTLILSAFDR